MAAAPAKSPRTATSRCTKRSFAEEAVFEGHHTKFRGDSSSSPGRNKNFGFEGRPTVYARGERLVDQHAAFGDALDDARQQVAPEVVGDDDGGEAPPCERPRTVLDVGEDHFGDRFQRSKRRCIAVDARNTATALHEPAHMPTRPARDVEHAGARGNEM